MSNQEPPQTLLRWKDLVAWQPGVTFYLMRKWRGAGLIKPKYVQGKSWPYYLKSDVKELLGLNRENN